MADLSDVENALVAAIVAQATPVAGALPMLGTSQIRVFRGGPPVTSLNLDRAAGLVDISVLPVPNSTRVTTRWGVQSATVAIAAGLSVSVSGQSADFSGAAVAGELAGVLVNNQAYAYRAAAGDSAALVAAALGDLIRVSQICWVSGAMLTVPGAVTLVARTAGVAGVVAEIARQAQEFRISIHAPSPATRDAVCSAIGPGLAQTAFLTLADGTAGRLEYRRTASFDDDQVASVYRRELIYEVEYGTTATVQTPVMLFGDLDYNASIIYV